MKTLKVLTSLLLTTVIIFISCFSAYASAINPDYDYGDFVKREWLKNLENAKAIYDDVVDKVENSNTIGDSLDAEFRALAMSFGLIVSGSFFLGANIMDFSGIGQVSTVISDAVQMQTEVADKLNDDIEFTDDSIILGPNADAILKKYIEIVQNNAGFVYVYSVPVTDMLALFDNATYYNKLKSFCYENESNYIIRFNKSKNAFQLMELADTGLIRSSNTIAPLVQFYDMVDWTSQNDRVYYRWDSTESDIISSTQNHTTNSNWGLDTRVKPTPDFILNFSATPQVYIVSAYNSYTYKMYFTLNDLKNDSQGIAPYYIGNGFQEFMNSSGTYTIGSENCNNVSYSDVTNYVNSFNTENGTNPTPTQITIYIQDTHNNGGENGGQGGQGGEGGQGGTGGQGGNATVTNTNNPTFNNNPNININLGFPSVSDNTVSGNGIHGGVNNIFDFLTAIGDVLGNLIKNIGNVLADIVEGIASIVSNLLESIPTVFGDFMGALIGWLPEELRALIMLSITAMIIVGLIKLFRG